MRPNPYASIALKDEVELDSLFYYLDTALSNILDKNNLHVFYETFYSDIHQSDLIRILLSFEGNQHEMMIRDLILEGLNRCRKIAGSSTVFLLVFVGLITRKLKVQTESDYCNRSEFATKKVAEQILHQYLGPKDGKLVGDIVEAAGSTGQVFIDKTALYSDNTLICVQGYHFPCYVAEDFSLIAGKNFKKKNVVCLIIDGLIESVGEIDRILRYSNENKQAVIIFARGFGNDVVSTLYTNYERSTLDIVPVHVGYDLEGVNLLKDIAVACNSDIVSSLKGELISSVDLSQHPIVSEVILDRRGTVIKNKSVGMKLHIKELKNIRKKSNIKEAEFVDKRIRSLSSFFVKFFVGKYVDNRDVVLERVEEGVRIFKEISNFGIIEIKKEEIGSKLDLTVPARSFLYGLRMGNSLYESVKSIGGFLTLEKS